MRPASQPRGGVSNMPEAPACQHPIGPEVRTYPYENACGRVAGPGLRRDRARGGAPGGRARRARGVADRRRRLGLDRLRARWLKSFAIDTFGAADKLVLVLVVTVVVGGLRSPWARRRLRRPRVGYASLVLLAAIGAVAALTRPNAEPIDALPAVTGAVAGAVTLKLLRRRLLGAAEPGEGARRIRSRIPSRGAASWSGARRVRRRGRGGGHRAVPLAALRGGGVSRRGPVPTGVAAAPPVPSGAELGVEGMTPFITPNADFYRIDTALIVPTVIAEEWSLRVHGMVERELTLDFEALMARPLIERDVTLACVSNEIGAACNRERPLDRGPPRGSARRGRHRPRGHPARVDV